MSRAVTEKWQPSASAQPRHHDVSPVTADQCAGSFRVGALSARCPNPLLEFSRKRARREITTRPLRTGLVNGQSVIVEAPMPILTIQKTAAPMLTLSVPIIEIGHWTPACICFTHKPDRPRHRHRDCWRAGLGRRTVPDARAVQGRDSRRRAGRDAAVAALGAQRRRAGRAAQVMSQ